MKQYGVQSSGDLIKNVRGSIAVDMSGGSVTLTADQAKFPVLVLQSAAAPVDLIWPLNTDRPAMVCVHNAAGETVSCKISGGSGVDVLDGDSAIFIFVDALALLSKVAGS